MQSGHTWILHHITALRNTREMWLECQQFYCIIYNVLHHLSMQRLSLQQVLPPQSKYQHQYASVISPTPAIRGVVVWRNNTCPHIFHFPGEHSPPNSETSVDLPFGSAWPSLTVSKDQCARSSQTPLTQLLPFKKHWKGLLQKHLYFPSLFHPSHSTVSHSAWAVLQSARRSSANI